MKLSATPLDGGMCRFLVWAPQSDRVAVVLDGHPVPMRRLARGYHCVETVAPPGTRYRYRLDDGHELADPASRSQPEGVFGPSAVVDPAFAWSPWSGPAKDWIIYECHIGTWTDAGTFEAGIERLAALAALGVTALEIMPVAQFPGSRNWGYDGVFPFAPQNTYGGPDGLRRLVDACHQHGLAVILDVVYNHLGPEGNVLTSFGHYFTDAYHTPWGSAMNFDGPGSDEVRRFFIENALHWAWEYHIDALRLDAVHAILDRSARPFLQQLASRVPVPLFAESDANDPRLVQEFGMAAVWADDLHHALHALLTGERGGCYTDFGPISRLAAAYRHGFAFTGQRNRYRDRRHGAMPTAMAPWQFVVCAQNHDQIGNRAQGERLVTLAGPRAAKVAAAAVLLSPFTPLLFMGEEYGETAPFLYFTSHTDPALGRAVRARRRREVGGNAPDPQREETFMASLIHPTAETEDFAELIRLRKEMPAGPAVVAILGPETLQLRRGRFRILLQFGGERAAALQGRLRWRTGDGGLMAAVSED